MNGQPIIRLTFPMKDIYTTVCLLQNEEGAVLFDTGTYDTDVETYILPFLQENGITEENLKYVFISHNHGDHAGGLECVLRHFPKVTVLSRSPKLKEKFGDCVVAPAEEERFLGVFQTVFIPGHTPDSMALLDLRSRTLVSGDCLQAYGIFGSGKWGANIRWPKEYFAALERVAALKPQAILAAHDYEPAGWQATGEEAVADYLEFCRTPLRRVRELILANPSLSDEELAELYGNGPVFPHIGAGVVKAMREFLK